jgi:hypothetical protein
MKDSLVLFAEKLGRVTRSFAFQEPLRSSIAGPFKLF